MARVAWILAVCALPAFAEEEGPAPLPKHLWSEGGKGGIAPAAPFTTQSFVKLAKSLGPAVVNISTVTVSGKPGEGETRPRGRGQGTGFVIEKSGYILTNNHVVENTEEIRVRLSDEREFIAHLVGRDERTDIAVIKIAPPSDIAVAPLGDSDKLEIGEWVVAIGNPFGLDHTVTAGIVSAKGRRDVKPGGTSAGYYDFIQTDASINAGNSGGPLINIRGEVVGINTAMTAQAQGIAFAIPINMAKALVPQLVALGRAPRSWLGLYPQPVTPSLKRAFSLPDTRGALVSDVVPGGPAEEAGVQSGDVVLEFDGHPIRRADDLQWLVAVAGAGRKVGLTLVRGGATRKVTATLGAQPDDTPPSASAPAPKHQSPLGMTVSEITLGIARELKQPDLRGVVVTAVESESPASEADVERGDVILRVGEVRIGTLEEYAKAVRAVPKGEMIRLLVRRENHNLWLAFPKR
jgi:serine protease Do